MGPTNDSGFGPERSFQELGFRLNDSHYSLTEVKVSDPERDDGENPRERSYAGIRKPFLPHKLESPGQMLSQITGQRHRMEVGEDQSRGRLNSKMLRKIDFS